MSEKDMVDTPTKDDVVNNNSDKQVVKPQPVPEKTTVDKPTVVTNPQRVIDRNNAFRLCSEMCNDFSSSELQEGDDGNAAGSRDVTKLIGAIARNKRKLVKKLSKLPHMEVMSIDIAKAILWSNMKTTRLMTKLGYVNLEHMEIFISAACILDSVLSLRKACDILGVTELHAKRVSRIVGAYGGYNISKSLASGLHAPQLVIDEVVRNACGCDNIMLIRQFIANDASSALGFHHYCFAKYSNSVEIIKLLDGMLKSAETAGKSHSG